MDAFLEKLWTAICAFGWAAAIVGAAHLNVRDAPSPKGAKIGELRRGARVTVLAASGDWRRIDGPAKADGWVHGSFLTGA